MELADSGPIRPQRVARVAPKAAATVEELEETARLVACGGPTIQPLNDAAIDALSRTFAARWRLLNGTHWRPPRTLLGEGVSRVSFPGPAARRGRCHAARCQKRCRAARDSAVAHWPALPRRIFRRPE